MEQLLDILAHGDDAQLLAVALPNAESLPDVFKEHAQRQVLDALQVFRVPRPDLRLTVVERRPLRTPGYELIVLRVPWLARTGEPGGDRRPLLVINQDGVWKVDANTEWAEREVRDEVRRKQDLRREAVRGAAWAVCIGLVLLCFGGMIVWSVAALFVEASRFCSVGKEAHGRIVDPALGLERNEKRFNVTTRTAVGDFVYDGHQSSFSGHYYLKNLDAVPVIYDPDQPAHYWVGRKSDGMFLLLWNNRVRKDAVGGILLAWECVKAVLLVLLGMLATAAGLCILYGTLARGLVGQLSARSAAGEAGRTGPTGESASPLDQLPG